MFIVLCASDSVLYYNNYFICSLFDISHKLLRFRKFNFPHTIILDTITHEGRNLKPPKRNGSGTELDMDGKNHGTIKAPDTCPLIILSRTTQHYFNPTDHTLNMIIIRYYIVCLSNPSLLTLTHTYTAV